MDAGCIGGGSAFEDGTRSLVFVKCDPADKTSGTNAFFRSVFSWGHLQHHRSQILPKRNLNDLQTQTFHFTVEGTGSEKRVNLPKVNTAKEKQNWNSNLDLLSLGPVLSPPLGNNGTGSSRVKCFTCISSSQPSMK